MLNKLVSFCKEHNLLEKGDSVVCAVSGGADSMALLWAMYLLREPLSLQLSAAHFDHGLRGQESQRDATFVADFCSRYDIPLFLERGNVVPGKKGLEAAARNARYSFFQKLPGKIATAHTADDNAETMLMHLLRGTGLKGLGGIAPKRDRLIRPMLSVTREDVIAFLQEYHIGYVTDSSNTEDAFLRNRLRHHVMPLLKQENPQLAVSLSAAALRLREDEKTLSNMVVYTNRVEDLRAMEPSLRYRTLAHFLETNGVKEPGADHIALLENILKSDNPSARADFPGGIVISRNYDLLEKQPPKKNIDPVCLPCPGQVEVDGIRILCKPAVERAFQIDRFTVSANGPVYVRARQPGDQLRLHGGTKKLKELFIDRKIPAAQRSQIPVVSDSLGVLGVYGFGANLDRVSETGIEICFEKI